MKTHILPAIKLTLGTLILFTVLYPALVWAFAQISPNRGKGEIVQYNGHTYYSNIGQSFTEDQYFWSRPSAVDYNASGSGASNKGPSNKEYLEAVQTRIETFMQHNPGIKKSDIPVDLVTASGSGLDPNISVQAAKVQIQRIATVRKLALSEVEQLVNQQIEKPLWGLFGPEKINVLKLNIALDQRSKK